jgi:hypothetical protein
MLWHL